MTNDRTSPETENSPHDFNAVERLVVEYFNAAGANVEFEEAEWVAQFDDPISLTSLAVELARIFSGAKAQSSPETETVPSPALDVKAVRQACDDWCWNKSGEPVGLMAPQHAAYQAFGAGAQYGFDIALKSGVAQCPDQSVSTEQLTEFISKQWWSGATCPSLASDILENFVVVSKAASPDTSTLQTNREGK